jgi:hypothetical protein
MARLLPAEYLNKDTYISLKSQKKKKNNNNREISVDLMIFEINTEETDD